MKKILCYWAILVFTASASAQILQTCPQPTTVTFYCFLNTSLHHYECFIKAPGYEGFFITSLPEDRQAQPFHDLQLDKVYWSNVNTWMSYHQGSTVCYYHDATGIRIKLFQQTNVGKIEKPVTPNWTATTDEYGKPILLCTHDCGFKIDN